MFAIYLPRVVASWFSATATDGERSQILLDEFGDPIIEMDEVMAIEKYVVDRFHSAAEYLPNIVSSLGATEKLEFYGLFKQATNGPADGSKRPSFLDMKERTKFDSWAQLGQMSRNVAMKSYVEKMENLNAGWDASRSGQSGYGIRPSRMMDYEETDSTSFAEQPSLQNKETALWFAASKADDVQTMKSILQNNPKILSECDPHLGMTALHWAIDSGCDNVVRLLLESGADVNVTDPEGNTPLHFAACCHRLTAAEFLLTRGANKTIRNMEGMTAADQCTDEPNMISVNIEPFLSLFSLTTGILLFLP